jgi:hypothetical protein
MPDCPASGQSGTGLKKTNDVDAGVSFLDANAQLWYHHHDEFHENGEKMAAKNNFFEMQFLIHPLKRRSFLKKTAD